MLNRVTSVLMGCSAGIAVVFLMDMVSQAMYPLPADFKPEKHEDWMRIMEIVPAGAFAVMLAGQFLGGITAGIVTSLLSKENKLRNAMIAAGVLTILGALNAFSIPHPIWFRAGTLFVYFAGAFIGNFLVTKLKKKNA